MEKRSWRTTSLGILCWIICARLLYMGNEMHDYSFSDLRKTTHQIVVPFLAFVVGWVAIHARDHRAK